MAIEINNVPPPSTASVDAGGISRSATNSPADTSPDKASSQSARADQVSLTPTAQQLRSLEEQIANQPVVDTQKVNAVRDALSNGSFEIDPSSIAGKMMSLERAMTNMG